MFQENDGYFTACPRCSTRLPYLINHIPNAPVTSVTGAGTVIIAANFENAFLRTQPSVSVADRKFYVSMKDRLCKARAHSSAAPDQTGTADDKNSVRRLSGGDGPDSDASA